METLPGDDGFKHLPVRMFRSSDGAMLPQKLYKALDPEKKQRRTLRDLLREAFPDKDPDEGTVNEIT